MMEHRMVLRSKRTRPVKKEEYRYPLSSHIASKVRLIWTKQCSRAYSPVSLNIVREVCSYVSFYRVLTKVSAKGIYSFDLATMQATKVTISNWQSIPRLSEAAASTCVGDQQVFACGGFFYKGLQQALLTDGPMLHILEPMKEGRINHAILFHEATMAVYVFGGKPSYWRSSLSTCEKYSLQDSSWSQLPPMRTGRSRFNVSHYTNSIFICGGYGAGCEVFSIKANQMTFLDDQSFPILDVIRFTAVHNGDLVVFSSARMYRWDVEKRVVTGNVGASIYGCYIPFCSIVKDNCVYYLQHYGPSCVCVDLETGSKSSETKFKE